MSILSSTRTGKSSILLIPETKWELKQMICDEIIKNGLNCSLNHIKTHKITDMSFLFDYSNFNGDISKWDVSKVTDMSYMFNGSEFNQDISNWDVSKVINMDYMFYSSIFNQPLNKWNPENVVSFSYMFAYTSFNQDISNWIIDASKSAFVNMFYCSAMRQKNKPIFMLNNTQIIQLSQMKL